MARAAAFEFHHAGAEDFFELVDLRRVLDEGGGFGVAGAEPVVVDAWAWEGGVGGSGYAAGDGERGGGGRVEGDGAEAFFEVGGFVGVVGGGGGGGGGHG